MSDFAEWEQHHLRLTILRGLLDAPNYTSNESIIARVAESFGFRRSRDHLKSQLRWLADVGVIKLQETEGFLIAELLRKGQDHLEGRIIVDGIKRPGPAA